MPEYLVAWTHYRNGETLVIADNKEAARDTIREQIETCDEDLESVAILSTREVREH